MLFSRLSFRSSFPLDKRILSAQNASFWIQPHRCEIMLQERGRSASVCMPVRETTSGQKRELGTVHGMDRAVKELLAGNGHLESHLVFTASSRA